MCLQAPSEATLQELETTCNSSAGESRGKGLPQAGAAPTRHGDQFCLLSLGQLQGGEGSGAGIWGSKLRLRQTSFGRNSHGSFHLCWQKSDSRHSSAAWG